jgi:hypothetical protein
MRKLSEFVKESIEINEKVFDLTYQITHDTLFSVGNGRLCMHMTLDGGDNSLYETIPDAGALFIPYKYNDKGNWAIVKISPRDKRNDRPVKNLVKKIKAKNQLSGEPITINMAREVIEEVKSIQPGLHPTPPMILQAVSNFYSVPVNQMLSKNKSKDVVQPRQMAMYLVRKLTNYSLPETGKVFSRDHTTVMHACDKIDKDRKINAELDDIIKTLIENIQNM